MRVRAKYILGPDFSIVENASLSFEKGVITEIGRATNTDKADLDFEESIIIPGMVNGHTHLDLCFAAGRVPVTGSFTHWLGGVLREIRAGNDNPEQVEQGVVDGLKQSIKAGVTLLGDIARSPQSTRFTISKVPFRPAIVSFGEVIALGNIREAATSRIAAAFDANCTDDTLRIGVSPHAPYSVEPSILSKIATHAEELNVPICSHAAETVSEEEFLLNGTGEFATYFQGLGIIDQEFEPAGKRSIKLLAETGNLTLHTILAHANYVDETDIDLLNETGTSVVFCPRTHAAFGHEPHPFKSMLAKGVNVCLGTDSLASTPNLSILEEMRFVYKDNPDLPLTTIMKMGTEFGARALGFYPETGTLQQSKKANFAVIPLAPRGNVAPLENILTSSENPCTCFINGENATAITDNPD